MLVILVVTQALLSMQPLDGMQFSPRHLCHYVSKTTFKIKRSEFYDLQIKEVRNKNDVYKQSSKP